MIILGPKTAILGPQFCRILVLGPYFWWSGGPGLLGPLDPPLHLAKYKTGNYHKITIKLHSLGKQTPTLAVH